MIILGYIAVLVFAGGLVCRGIRIKMMPVHLRWELSPVPHEKRRAHYGGSYLEEFEWWTKPREKSLMNEGFYMFQEIVFLKGVWEHNPSLWAFSFPFHFGLYLMAGTICLLVTTAAGASFLAPLALWAGRAAAVLGSVGVLGLLAKRLTCPRLRPYTSLGGYFNLVFLAAVFLSAAWAAFSAGYVGEMTAYIKALFTGGVVASLGAPAAAHVATGLLFLVYLPFTPMMHFVAKYFTYHEVRWNDEPMSGNAAMESEVKGLLGQVVTWSAPHIGADGKKNWVDIATAETKKGK